MMSVIVMVTQSELSSDDDNLFQSVHGAPVVGVKNGGKRYADLAGKDIARERSSSKRYGGNIFLAVHRKQQHPNLDANTPLKSWGVAAVSDGVFVFWYILDGEELVEKKIHLDGIPKFSL